MKKEGRVAGVQASGSMILECFYTRHRQNTPWTNEDLADNDVKKRKKTSKNCSVATGPSQKRHPHFERKC